MVKLEKHNFSNYVKTEKMTIPKSNQELRAIARIRAQKWSETQKWYKVSKQEKSSTSNSCTSSDKSEIIDRLQARKKELLKEVGEINMTLKVLKRTP